MDSDKKKAKGRKNFLHLKKKSRLTFNNREKLLFYWNRNFIKVNLPI